MTPRLISTRFKKIDVHTGPGDKLQGGGKMSVEVTAGLGSVANDNRRVVAEVTIAVKGIPDKAKDASQYAFSAVTVMQGIYEWPKEAPGNLEDKDLTNTLCQPLYVSSVSEITLLVQRTRLGTISLPWTIDDNGEEPPTKKLTEKKNALRKTRKKITP